MFEKTPLIQAIDSGDISKAVELYNQGERIPHSQHAYDYSQLYDTLIRKKGYELISLMLQNNEIEKDIYMLDKIEDSIFSKLVKVKNPDEEFISFFSDLMGQAENINDEVSGHTLISFAVESAADSAIIQALIDAGCRVDFKNQSEDNLLNISIRKHSITPEHINRYIEIFLSEGLDINETNKVGKTPLHIAMENNKYHVLENLLQNGASPNQQDKEGNSAFFIAVAHKHDAEQYKKLSEYESMDFEQTNKNGEKALHNHLRMIDGAENTELILQMIEDGADLNNTAPHYGKPVSAWDWIAQKKSPFFEQVFKQAQPEINEQDDLGNTLLHKVVMKDSNYDQNDAKETYKKVKFLLDNGATASILNNKEQSAMAIASEDNLKGKTVELLLIAQQKEN